MNRFLRFVSMSLLLSLVASCKQTDDVSDDLAAKPSTVSADQSVMLEPGSTDEKTPNKRFDIYTSFTLTADLGSFSSNQKSMIKLLIDASKIMDSLFWLQAVGDKDAFLSAIENPDERKFAEINYGPWDRLDGNASFVKGFQEKPKGAQFYPHDITQEELATAQWVDKTKGLYSIVERDSAGKLFATPYSEYYKPQLSQVAQLLRQASKLADNQAFSKYLVLRADALLTDEYFESDSAWMEMKDNPIELVIGPIESYEDQLLGARTSFESYVLIKDLVWSEKLAKFTQYLPELQQGLPVDIAYKSEQAGTDADLNAYDVIYYAGDCNAGSKTIAINLPNDEKVQLEKGTRRLQLKNAMRAKFDKILVPISSLLIDSEQQKYVTFDAFFANTMFHEVAHGLGIKNTLDGQGTVREALKEHASALEEGKADILGLYMVTELRKRGVIDEGELMENYVTFMASIFRSIRFGVSSAHGRANMIRFNYFKEKNAFTYNKELGSYRINAENMQQAMAGLSHKILTLQGNGDYSGVNQLLEDYAAVPEDLQSDLNRLSEAKIPVDVVFEQGVKVLGL